jgi:hypothetical protein
VAFDLLPMLNVTFCENEPCFPRLECYLSLSLLLLDKSHAQLYKQQKSLLKHLPLFFQLFCTQNEDLSV